MNEQFDDLCNSECSACGGEEKKMWAIRMKQIFLLQHFGLSVVFLPSLLRGGHQPWHEWGQRALVAWAEALNTCSWSSACELANPQMGARTEK